MRDQQGLIGQLGTYDRRGGERAQHATAVGIRNAPSVFVPRVTGHVPNERACGRACSALPLCSMSRRASEPRAYDVAFDTDKFICEVERRPALYNINLIEYSDRAHKWKLWQEIAVSMYDNWEKRSYYEKNELTRGLQSKWKSIRDHFKKVYKHEKASEGVETKRRKYVYYDQLLFLRAYLENRHNCSNTNEMNEEIFLEPKVEITEADTFTQISTSRPDRKRTRIPMQLSFNTKMKQLTDVLAQSVALQNENKDVDEMGNKAFLMSLLPVMNSMSEDDMIDIRLQILQVIQNYQLRLRQQNLECLTMPSPSTSSNG